MFQSLISTVPADIDIECEGSDYSTVVPIAACGQTGRVVSVDCRLDYTSNLFGVPASAWFHEFSFSITCADVEGGEVFTTQDRTIARRYIPEDAIPVVMPIVLACCDAMVTRVRPRSLYRVTKMAKPTDRALEKHNLITILLHSRGYMLLQQGTDTFHRTFWHMGTTN